MSIQKLLGINSLQGTKAVSGVERHVNHFAKEAFNFGTANPNRPYGVVAENALGDPTRGTKLYCLG